MSCRCKCVMTCNCHERQPPAEPPEKEFDAELVILPAGAVAGAVLGYAICPPLAFLGIILGIGAAANVCGYGEKK